MSVIGALSFSAVKGVAGPLYLISYLVYGLLANIGYK